MSPLLALTDARLVVPEPQERFLQQAQDVASGHGRVGPGSLTGGLPTSKLRPCWCGLPDSPGVKSLRRIPQEQLAVPLAGEALEEITEAPFRCCEAGSWLPLGIDKAPTGPGVSAQRTSLHV